MATKLLLRRASGSASSVHGFASLRYLASRLLHDGAAPRPDPRSPPPCPSPVSDLPAAVASPVFGTRKIWSCDHGLACHSYRLWQGRLQPFAHWFSGKAEGDETIEQKVNESCTGSGENQQIMKSEQPKVLLFSPLEATLKVRPSGLNSESLKIKRMELSQKITFYLIPALLLISKTKLTTSVMLLSVFWQIYGFFKEIFLDYVHQEVTRTWVLIYLKLLLLIVLKDILLYFDLL